jgi:ribosomal protein S19
LLRAVKSHIKMQVLKKRYEKIVAQDVNTVVFTHDGAVYKKLKVCASMLEHKFGEFARTKKTAKCRKK